MVGVLRESLVSKRAIALAWLLAFAFVCVQAAAGVHSVAHLDEEVTESCFVCLKIDGDDSIVTSQALLVDLVVYSDEYPLDQNLVGPNAVQRNTSIRAPPSPYL